MLDYQFLKTNIFNIVNVDAQKVLNSIEDEEDEQQFVDKSNPRKRKRLDDFTPQERMIRRYCVIFPFVIQFCEVYCFQICFKMLCWGS